MSGQQTDFSNELGDGLLECYTVNFAARALTLHIQHWGDDSRWEATFKDVTLHSFRGAIPGLGNVVFDLEETSFPVIVSQFRGLLDEYRGYYSGIPTDAFADDALLAAALNDGIHRPWILRSSSGMDGFILATSCEVTRIRPRRTSK